MKFELKSEHLIPLSIIIGSVLISISVLFSAKVITADGPSHAVVSTTTSPNPTQPATPVVDVSKVHTAGEPFIGNANAPLTIAYWSDYQCPFCRQNEENTFPQIITDYVDTGKVKVVFKDFQFLGADSQTLGQFGRAVWALAPHQFYAWHKAVYDAQGTENTGWATHDKIMSITSSVLGMSLANQVDALVTSQGAVYQKEMDADKTEAASFSVTGTPSFVIGSQLIVGAEPYDQIKSAIDAQLNK
jgi:protein-disulfide isomerase